MPLDVAPGIEHDSPAIQLEVRLANGLTQLGQRHRRLLPPRYRDCLVFRPGPFLRPGPTGNEPPPDKTTAFAGMSGPLPWLVCPDVLEIINGKLE